jgi:hypothetical protein
MTSTIVKCYVLIDFPPISVIPAAVNMINGTVNGTVAGVTRILQIAAYVSFCQRL